VDRDSGAFVAPSLDEPMHVVVGAVISAPPQFFEQTLGRAALPLRLDHAMTSLTTKSDSSQPAAETALLSGSPSIMVEDEAGTIFRAALP
jgi:hypothetical protein